MLAVITFGFDPLLRVGERTIPLESIGIALAILLGILLAARIALEAPVASEEGGPTTSIVDLLLLAVAAVPGAVLGGRIGDLLLHADWYAVHPAAIVDPSRGGFELALGVVGGTCTALLFATALHAPVGRWLQVAAVPLLVALAFGKLAMALGGSGQGAPWFGLLATSYAGPGPWNALDPAGAAWPAQLLEGGATLLAAVAVALLAAGSRPGPAEMATPRPSPASPAIADGRAFLLALWAWGAIRLLVSLTWRDAAVVGPFRAEALIALALAGAAAFGYVALVRRTAARGR